MNEQDSIIIRPMRRRDAAKAAVLHKHGIRSGFIASLGYKFIKTLYSAIAIDKSSVCFVAVENNEIIGFITITTDINALYRAIIWRKGPKLLALLMTQTFSNLKIRNILETLFYPKRTGKLSLPSSELLSVVIHPKAARHGLATKLVTQAFAEGKRRGIDEVKILVGAMNEAANNFYSRCGFKLSGQILNHKVLSNIYIADLNIYLGKFAQVSELEEYYNDFPSLPEYRTMLDEFLQEHGVYVINVHDVKWREYAGFMMPAYLPHCCPPVTIEMANEVLHISGRPFVRWATEFGRQEPSEWWYVLKKGSWSIEDVPDKKKRWMIRQGRKSFTVRPLTLQEVIKMCPQVARASVNRYEIEFSETRGMLKARLEAAEKVPGVLEYIGCFSGDKLVSFAENYIQDNAVFMVYIRQIPEYLKDYSSYALVDGILEYYLNQKKFRYVLDGSRCIHHHTSFQEVLIKVFGFQKEYALLNVVYSKKFALCVRLAWPFRKVFWAIWGKWSNSFFDNVSAVLRQEAVRRSCRRLRPDNISSLH